MAEPSATAAPAGASETVVTPEAGMTEAGRPEAGRPEGAHPEPAETRAAGPGAPAGGTAGGAPRQFPTVDPDRIREGFESGTYPYSRKMAVKAYEAEKAKLQAELRKVKRQGWSHDRGEFSISVHSFGAPIYNPDQRMVGALSIPYLPGRGPTYDRHVKQIAIQGAIAISADVPDA